MGTSLTARIIRHVVDVDLELELAQSPVTVLFGTSGAGKTTILRCIAGLDTPEPGSHVALGDQVWFDAATNLPARRRHIGYLFQDHALFPHLSVNANVAYGLRSIPRHQRPDRVREALTQAGAEHLSGTEVRHLSGGEAQRVALARALAPRPQLLLLDEPLSALDTPTRTRLQAELRAVLRAAGVPALVVTHDRAEALALGDRVVVLLDGRARQIGDVATAFSHPADHHVAAAVGTETILRGRVSATVDQITHVETGGVPLYAIAAEPLPTGTEVLACIRAEEVALINSETTPSTVSSSPRNHLPATVTTITDQGPLLRVDLDAGFGLAAYITRPTRDDLDLAPGRRVVAAIKAPAVHLIPRS